MIPRPWERIVVNYETTFEDGPDSDYCFFYVARSDAGDLEIDDDLPLTNAVEDMFFELNDALFASTKSRWGICDLIINSDGHYDFSFDYGPAKRLNGVLDDSSLGRFDNYLESYKAELAAAGKA